jgi:hypothetical protein
MIMAAAWLRGGVRYSDAFFPLTMLSFGQMENFLWAWVFNHILPNVIVCGLLMVVVFRGREPHLLDTFLVATVLVVLFLSGPVGLPYVLALATWLGYVAILNLRDPLKPQSRRDGLITLVLAFGSVAMIGLYFADYHVRPGTAAGVPARETGLIDALKTSFRILCVSFGPVVVGYVRPLGLTLLGLLFVTAVVLVRTWLGQPQERLRASGLLLFIGAAVALLLAVGRARAGLSWAWHLRGIYLNMAIPALCATYLIMILYGRPAVSGLVQTALFTLTCFFFLKNFEAGMDRGRNWHISQQKIERDIKAGVPLSIVAARQHLNFGLRPAPFMPINKFHEALAQSLRRYKELGIPQFQAAPPDSDYRELRLPITPSTLNGVVWHDGVVCSCSCDPEDASLVYSLDRPLFIYAIRLRCSYEGAASGVADMRMEWSAGNAPDSRDSGRRGSPNGDELLVSKTPLRPQGYWGERASEERDQTLTFWVNSEIDRFRIHPDTEAFALKISEIVLLVPPDDPSSKNLSQ